MKMPFKSLLWFLKAPRIFTSAICFVFSVVRTACVLRGTAGSLQTDHCGNTLPPELQLPFTSFFPN